MTDCGTMKRWLKPICLFVVLVLGGTGSYGSDRSVVRQYQVLGTALVHDRNLVAGRENAVHDALAAAVGQVVMELLTSDTVVRRFQLINDSILAQRNTYVKNYRVLTELVSGSTVRVLVQVDVAVDRVSQDLSRLGFALAGEVYPRILLMMAEKNVSDADYTYWWGERRVGGRTIVEGAMITALQASGFEIIDPPDLSAPLGRPPHPSETEMIPLARRLGADVLILGHGTALTATNIMGASIKAFEGVVAARAFQVQSGQAIGSSSHKTVVSGADDVTGGRAALAGAGETAGAELARQIMIAWQEERDRSAVIEVMVDGTAGHIASFVRLRTAIASLSGVRELKMNEMSADRAVMAVSYQGLARTLADALLLRTFDGFGIDIFEVTSEVIRIRLVH